MKQTGDVTSQARGVVVTERLDCSPPIKAIWVQSPAGSLRIFACGNRAGKCHRSAGFLGGLPFPPPFNSGTAPYSPKSPSNAPKTSVLEPSKYLHSLLQAGLEKCSLYRERPIAQCVHGRSLTANCERVKSWRILSRILQLAQSPSEAHTRCPETNLNAFLFKHKACQNHR
ncbi:hypothetical protein PR048_025808 [Dryococelus australis]|uniref:Uncharacterized protein n=1 Tax=Dryococelus australis TaxID=614101 RepID=A0ABQ9GJL0_9NEOP|nr:hypothetical protein PR048_025808 [Dryococelus australis]